MKLTLFPNVIAVLPERLGDTLFYTPLLKLFKRHGFNTDVIALSALSADVFAHNPTIRKIILQPTEKELNALKNHYHYAICIHPSDQAKQLLKNFHADYIDYPVDRKENAPAAEKLIRDFSRLFQWDEKLNFHDLSYELFPQEADFAKTEELLRGHSKENKLIGFHLGCHGLAKSRTRFWQRFRHEKAWPIDYFIELARRINQLYPEVQFVLTGSKSEVALGDKFCRHLKNVTNLIDRTSLLQLSALMRYLTAYITNDTGAMHVACASKVNLIALFGKDSNPRITGPYPSTPYRLVLQRDALDKLKPIDVLSTLLPFLS